MYEIKSHKILNGYYHLEFGGFELEFAITANKHNDYNSR